MSFNSITEIIDDIRHGKMVIIVDDKDRENEGDLLMAASMVRPEDINFMARYGRGLICLTLTRERCRQLNLPLMVGVTDDRQTTNFTISIEAAEGVTTGISAYDRAHTVRTAVAPNTQPKDIAQPGHIFPLMAQPGGVLTRAGHTEAGCDLARLAGLEPAAVIVEILNDDGSMARRSDLEIFAAQHRLKIGTIEELIRFRIEHEKTVHRVAERPFSTDFGEFRLYAYEEITGKSVHLALVKGEVEADTPILVRVHIENTLCDVLFSNSKHCGWPLRDAIRRIAEEDSGVIVLLRMPVKPADIVAQVRSFKFKMDPEVADKSDGPPDRRTLGIGAQILADLSVTKMRLLSAPQRFHGLGGFGLKVVEYVQKDASTRT
jgi:3,4-dihydroxy 2-butanone 4-phosphate synthase/GTP cyclohydrolase II